MNDQKREWIIIISQMNNNNNGWKSWHNNMGLLSFWWCCSEEVFCHLFFNKKKYFSLQIGKVSCTLVGEITFEWSFPEHACLANEKKKGNKLKCYWFFDIFF